MATYDLATLVGKELTADRVASILTEVRDMLEALDEVDFTRTHLDRGLRAIANSGGIEAEQLFRPLRVALQGSVGHPGLYESMMLTGRRGSIRLLNEALKELGAMASS